MSDTTEQREYQKCPMCGDKDLPRDEVAKGSAVCLNCGRFLNQMPDGRWRAFINGHYRFFEMEKS